MRVFPTARSYRVVALLEIRPAEDLSLAGFYGNKELFLHSENSDSEGTTLSCGSSEDVPPPRTGEKEVLERHSMLKQRLSKAKYMVRRRKHIMSKKAEESDLRND